MTRRTVMKRRRWSGGFLARAEAGAKLNWVEIECAFCRGRGRDPFKVLSCLSNCPVCHGKGKAWVVAPYETCPACQGTGLYSGTRMYCWACHGTGVRSVRIRMEVWGDDQED